MRLGKAQGEELRRAALGRVRRIEELIRFRGGLRLEEEGRLRRLLQRGEGEESENDGLMHFP